MDGGASSGKPGSFEQRLHSWSTLCPNLTFQAAFGVYRAEALAQAGVKIQSGGQGTVVAVEDPHTRQMIAVKYISADEKRAKQSETAAVSFAPVLRACRRATNQNPQLRRLDNSHPHIIQTHGMLKGASGSVYIMQERAVCDLHDAAGACAGRVMGEGEHVKEWMLQVAHGEFTDFSST